MSSRRVPLSSNQNIANSPVRKHPSALTSVLDKHRQQKRTYASVQREEQYGQPPPAKKKLLNDGSEQRLRSPTRQVKIHRKDLARPYKDDKTTSQTSGSKAAQQDDEVARVQRWKEATQRSFPGFVFYFESCPAELRSKLIKQLNQLGAREEKFFSKDITHVITTRKDSIPTGKPSRDHTENAPMSTQPQRSHHEMPKTIDPSLLTRDNSGKDVRRRLLESTRKVHVAPPSADNALRQPTASRNTDILVRAHEMNKKIWHYSKLTRVFEVMFNPDPCGLNANAPKEEANLAQLLNKERATGPSDRDPTVATKELAYFKGSYIYVYDIEEKQKPIMVREYPKVADKKDGEWPQFRASSNGRCPFVEDDDVLERKRQAEKQAREKQRQERMAAGAAPELKPPSAPMAKPVTGKRTVSEMEDSNKSRPNAVRKPEVFDLTKAANPPTLDFSKPEVFTNRTRAARPRLFGGEPVASGMQPSNVTSAIRSQMISSTACVSGAKAGTSKALHGLQRQVLQKSNATSINPTSQDLSSRRLAEMSLEAGNYQRSASLGHTSRKLGQIDENNAKEHKRTMSVPTAVPHSKPKKRELKPGYCENCQEKFEDFEEHIASRKHRKFAENDKNWSKLDSLLGQLERVPKYADDFDGGVSDY